MSEEPVPRFREAERVREDRLRSVSYSVYGFWPRDVIIVRQKKGRDKHWEESEIKWSSGGRQYKDEEADREISDVEASQNFADALADAIAVAEEWNQDVAF